MDQVSKFNITLKTFLLQGLSGPGLYGYFVYKQKIAGENVFFRPTYGEDN